MCRRSKKTNAINEATHQKMKINAAKGTSQIVHRVLDVSLNERFCASKEHEQAPSAR